MFVLRGLSSHCTMLTASLDSVQLCHAQMLSGIAKNPEDWEMGGVKQTLVGNQWSAVNSPSFTAPDFSSETFPLEIILRFYWVDWYNLI